MSLSHIREQISILDLYRLFYLDRLENSIRDNNRPMVIYYMKQFVGEPYYRELRESIVMTSPDPLYQIAFDIHEREYRIDKSYDIIMFGIVIISIICAIMHDILKKDEF
jgi:hypothetical protein